MGKKKDKKKLGADVTESQKDDIDDNAASIESNTNTQQKKKSRKKNLDDWEDDVSSELALLSLNPDKDNHVALENNSGEVKKGNKNKKGKKNQDLDDWDELMKDDEPPVMGSNSMEKKDEVLDTNKSKKGKKKKKKDDNWEDDIEKELAMIATGQEPIEEKEEENTKKKPKTNKKAKKKKNDDWEDDIEKELEMIASGQAPTDDKNEDVDVKKKGKGNKKMEKIKKDDVKSTSPNDDASENVDTKESEPPEAAKTKKGKKKKKKNDDNWEDDIEKELEMIAAGKEPEKEEEEEKKKTKPNKKSDTKKTETKPSKDVPEETKDNAKVESVEKETAAVDSTQDSTAPAAETPAATTSKKKRKKKGAKEEEEKATKKKPSKAIKMMQEALKKRKEEEEKFRLAEEEKIRLEEEAFRRRQEERERIERKKQLKKEARKERILKQKKEGVYLTPAQREAKKRNEAYLKQLEEHGIRLPVKGQEPGKRPLYGNKKKQNKSAQKAEKQKSVSEKEEKKEEVKEEVPEEKEELEKEPVVEIESESESDDDWEVIADKEEAKHEEEDSEESSSEEESESEESEEEEEEEEEELSSREKALNRIEKLRQLNESKRTVDELRSPVICVMGHVDTGKTKILDKIRHTHVQDGEAGGITQQIGATNIPVLAIKEQTKMVKNFSDIRVPGLLVIDTPGHESFSNLRSRGSSLCDMAILVVDIMHGLEPQTIESINMLRKRKTPFVVALNKIDRLYRWKANPKLDVVSTINQQDRFTKDEFQKRVNEIIVEFAKQELNVKLFHENDDPDEWISMVPTSAHSGDGMGNLMAYVVNHSQTQLAKRLSYSENLQCTVLEVKAIVGLGTTVDVILTNGRLKYGDTIVLPGVEGPIVTHVKGLLMPQPLKELRVKNPYDQFREIKAAQGVKVLAKELDKALAGTSLLVARHDDEIQILRDEVQAEVDKALRGIKLQERGVFVQASTLGSLEALLEFLKQSKIPYAGINIGPIHKKDVMKASVMLEHDEQWAVILAFDVKVEREAQELADHLDVKIFTADIIYHLFDAFIKYREDLKKRKQDEYRHLAIFPCKLKIVPNCVFKSRDPIVVGVSIEAGQLRVGTPICVPDKEFLTVGVVSSIEANHKSIEIARKPQEVCIKIENVQGEAPKLVGRHFDESDVLTSKISRDSIDLLKNYYREEMQKSDWQLVIELKKLFEII